MLENKSFVGGKLTEAYAERNGVLRHIAHLDEHNMVVNDGLDYLMTWRGTNDICRSSSSFPSSLGFQGLYGLPNPNKNNSIEGTTFDLSNGQIGPLTFGAIGSDASPTHPTDTELKAPIYLNNDGLARLQIDDYQPNLLEFHAVKATYTAEEQSWSLRVSFKFPKLTEDTVVREFATYGRYVPITTSLNSNNMQQSDLYTGRRMFSRVVIPDGMNYLAGDCPIFTYEFTFKMPLPTPTAATLFGKDCEVLHFFKDDNNNSDWANMSNDCTERPLGWNFTIGHSEGTEILASSSSSSSFSSSSSSYALCGVNFSSHIQTPKKQTSWNYLNNHYGLYPVCFIEDMQDENPYNWCNRNTDWSNDENKQRALGIDCNQLTHTVANYIPGSFYRDHTYDLQGFSVARPNVYGFGIGGMFVRFGKRDSTTKVFTPEPFAMNTRAKLNFKVRYSISASEG